uniref:Tyrosine-protein phosphatase non-receptor type 12-like isoform X2 n=1 Tax=Dermatophagoides pteronyssinus TaxID=6956 RepID=A0A6P6Y274_DERPT|nr:tyrosine-protein phosphatase non-receptor type 12-like isoform X2 [Dermatophagoides pteronyssinus]
MNTRTSTTTTINSHHHHHYQPIESLELGQMQHTNNTSSSSHNFISYVNNSNAKESIETGNGNSKSDDRHNIKTVSTLDKQTKLRSFLMTINNHYDRYDFDDNEDDFFDLNQNSTKLKTNRPLPIHKFFAVYQSLSKDSDFGFSNEFAELEQKSHNDLYTKLPLVDCNRNPEMNIKNRFQNVLPYKHTLVKLSDGHDGYINASFIAGHNGPHEYIATLAPWNQDSIRNFYRLILEYHVVIIVNLVEFESIAYLPKWINDEPKRIKLTDDQPMLIVRLVEEKQFDQYVIRHIQLMFESADDQIIHEAYQFHFTGWKDFAVPEQELPILLFIQKVRHYFEKYCSSSSTPIIVHCRAGIGRTGTYIAIDHLWQQLTEKFLQPEFHRQKLWLQSLQWNELRYLHRQQLQNRFTRNEIGSHTLPTRSIGQWMPNKLETLTQIFHSTTATLGRRFHNRKMAYNIDNNDHIDPIKQDTQAIHLLSKVPYMIDIYGIVYRMRSDRRGMVQTDSQYAYIHRCVYYILKNFLCLQLKDHHQQQQQQQTNQITNESNKQIF